MLSQPDAALARRDPALPGLATVLDNDALLTSLRNHAPQLGARSVTVRYLRYKPGTNCIAALSIDLAETTTTAYVKAFGSDAPRKWEPAGPPTQAAPQSRFQLHGIQAELRLFPDDHKLVHLRHVSDPAWATRRSPLAARDASRSGSVRVTPLAYKPERRFVAQWTFSDDSRYVAKSYRAADFEAAQRNSRLAATLGFGSHSLPSVARDRRATLLFPWTRGALLADLLADPTPPEALCHQVGATLAAMHRPPASPELPFRPLALEGARLRDLERQFGFLLPHRQSLLTSIVRKITSALPSAHGRTSLVHGDFHAGQILATDRGPHFLDFDEAHAGDPAEDLATFLARLERETIAGTLSESRRTALSNAFLNGYHTAHSEPLPTHLSLLIASRLFADAPHPFRSRHPAWLSLTEATLDRIDALITGHTRRRVNLPRTEIQVAPQSPFPDAPASPSATGEPRLADPSLPTLADALNPEIAGPCLLPMLSRACGESSLQLESIEVRRHKPGRRCLIEYRFQAGTSGTYSVIAKLRRRGVDSANFALLQALSRNGFGEGAADGIAIPQPLGEVPALALTLCRKAPGTPLTELLGNPATAVWTTRAADALHKLHRSHHSIARRHAISDELDTLRERLPAVAADLPALRHRILDLLDGCLRLGSRIPAAFPVLLHRDFYPDQILIDGDRLWLLDLDLAATGDPALDAGNFLAHVMELALRIRGDVRACAPAEHAFRVRVLSRSLIAPESLHAWTTLALARHVAISHQFPERRHLTSAILDLCEERLSLDVFASH